MQTYDEIIGAAAGELESQMRQAAKSGAFGTVHVWAVPTNDKRNGFLFVGAECPEFGARYVRPNDNGASTYSRWDAAPYSSFSDILWRACRHDPIMPIHASEAEAIEALSAYKAESAKLFAGAGFSRTRAFDKFQNVKSTFHALPAECRASYADFADYLACNDALPLSELRAELA